MNQGKLFLQVTSILLLVGMIGLIFGSKYWVNPDPRKKRSGAGVIPRTVPEPEHKSRVFFGHAGACLSVLAPCSLPESRQTREQKWISQCLEVGKSGVTPLVLHIFHGGGEASFTFDPDLHRVELLLEGQEGTASKQNVSVHSILKKTLSETERLIFRTLAPDRPITLKSEGLTRVLLCFEGNGLWSKTSGVRILLGEETVRLRSAEVTYVEWESLLAGGPFPRALAPDAGQTPDH